MTSPHPLAERIRELPDRPGIYVFKDAGGKATSLRKRVSSYMTRDHEPRLEAMVSEAAEIDFGPFLPGGMARKAIKLVQKLFQVRICRLDQLIQRADQALYRAKDEGRNRTVVFSRRGKALLQLTDH